MADLDGRFIVIFLLVGGWMMSRLKTLAALAVALLLNPAFAMAFEPLTIETEFQFLETTLQGTTDLTMHIAGISSHEGGTPDVLAFQWVGETRGWFPSWKLRLTSKVGLLPDHWVDGQDDDQDGDGTYIELGNASPRTGHLYRTRFSYNPHTHFVSLHLEDVTQGDEVYSTHLSVKAYSNSLYPSVGGMVQGLALGEEEPEPFINLEHAAVTSSYHQYGLPLAMRRSFGSRLLQMSPDEKAEPKLGTEYLADDPVGLRLEWPQNEVVGEVRITSLDSSGEKVLSASSWASGHQDVFFDPNALSLGDSTLILEYVDGTHRTEIARHHIRRIKGKVHVGYDIYGRDYARNRLLGRVTIAPEFGDWENAELSVRGVFRPSDSMGAAGASAQHLEFEVLRKTLQGLENDRLEAVGLEKVGSKNERLENERLENGKLENVWTVPFEVEIPPSAGQLELTASFDQPGLVAVGADRRYSVSGAFPYGEDSDLFPFVVDSWWESPSNITNVSHWLEKPAGKKGFVKLEDGQFVSADGQPLRFLGVNCAFAGCFPDHATAQRLARQLARFGINLMRFHHMDMQDAPNGIWQPGSIPRRLDARQLDRLDYFIYQLKKNGIYSNLNLHVSRTMSPREGFPEPHRRPDFDKGLSLYHPQIIEHQKEYARALLTHRNRYTGNRYVDEPAIAMVEITNENGLIRHWQFGEIDALPPMYQEPLDQLWQEWLQKRYSSTQELRTAWGGSQLTLGEEMVENGYLIHGTRNWHLETGAGRATMDVITRGGPIVSPTEVDPTKVKAKEAAGELTAEEPAFEVHTTQIDAQPLPALEVKVFQKGTFDWHPQFHHTGFRPEPGKEYLISFWLKADQERSVTANVKVNHEPWVDLWSTQVTIGTQWQRYEYGFQVPADAVVHEARIGLTNLDVHGTYWIAGVSLREKRGGRGLPEGETLEGGVSRPSLSALGLLSEGFQRDYISFIWDLERDYFLEMYRFVKEDLGVQVPVSGSQVPFSPLEIQADLDYVDAHEYWRHPHFPGESWDGQNWYIANDSLVTDPSGGPISSLARYRAAGKPYIVSEYNHSAPNTFGSEAFLLTGAFGAFQNWDGLVAFAWSHDSNFWLRHVPSFFDIKSHPTKLVTLPAVAALLLRGDVQPGKEPVFIPLDQLGNVPRSLALQRRIAVVVDETTDQPAVNGEEIGAPFPADWVDDLVAVSDTGELHWDRSVAEHSIFLVDTARSKVVIGYGEGRTFDLSGVVISPGSTRQEGWSTITLTAIDGDDFFSPGRILVAATGYVENVGMGWEVLEGNTMTVRSQWGQSPSMVEGIPARIELPVAPDRVKVYALDGTGERWTSVPTKSAMNTDDNRAEERAIIDIGPDYRTLWYEIEVLPNE